MGAWGVAILSNDLTEDVSFRYKDLLSNNYSSEDASRIVIAEFQNELDDDEITTFWLTFACIQWKLGRLQDEVKDIAIQIIDSGDDLEYWADDDQLKKKRQAVLLKLKEQINSSQPQAKKIPKRFIANTDLKDGDVISYQLLTGDYILLKVIRIIEEWTGDRYPLFEICDWRGKVIPTNEYISRLQLKEWVWENGNRELIKLAIYQAGKRDDPSKRIKKVAEKIDVILDKDPSHTLITWKELDKKLEQFYQLK